MSFLLGASLLMPLDLLNLAAPLMSPLHQHCVGWAPQASPYKDLYAAMVCGSNIRSPSLQDGLRRTALIHLIVVSGAHLVLLEQGLRFLERRLHPPAWIMDTLLWFYGFVTLLNPPITRALLQRGIQRLSDRHGLFWPRSSVVIASGVFGLALFPAWWTSLSFQLSLVASLALEYARLLKIPVHLVVYILMVPLLLTLHAPHPASILVNAVATPIFGVLLLPISWIGFLPGAYVLTDTVWWIFSEILKALVGVMPVWSTQPAPPSDVGRWIYIAGIQCGGLFLERWRHRRRPQCK